jgi:hypothetical protein
LAVTARRMPAALEHDAGKPIKQRAACAAAHGYKVWGLPEADIPYGQKMGRENASNEFKRKIDIVLNGSFSEATSCLGHSKAPHSLSAPAVMLIGAARWGHRALPSAPQSPFPLDSLRNRAGRGRHRMFRISNALTGH